MWTRRRVALEATYKRVAAGKRKSQRTAVEQRTDRRRLIQLLVSLSLFLLVFVGRGVFPAWAENWNEMVTADTDFAGAFQQFGQDLAGDESFWLALTRLAAASFGGEVTEPQSAGSTEPAETDPPAIVGLSETELHGFSYLRGHGFAVYRDNDARQNIVPEQEVVSVPEIVTAVAQAYNAAGEKLPSNVSYEYYELGLEQTIVPVMGTVTSGFEYRTSPITGSREFHLALDIAAAEGTEIRAFADGVVRYIGESDDFGLYLMIDHDNGVSTFYAHCSKLLVHKGDTVACGDTIALVGHTGNATGAHLHFTLLKDNIRLDPAYYVDPS